MLKKFLLGAALTTALSTGALAQPGTGSPATSMDGAAITTPDYIKAASQSDEFEIQEGRMAMRRGKDERVKQMGAKMVTDHSMTTRTLHGAMIKAGMPVPPPPPLRPDQQQMVSGLQAMSGADFDRTYLAQQLPAHQEALALHTAYSKAGEPGPIRDAASAAIPIVRNHLDMVQNMQGRTD